MYIMPSFNFQIQSMESLRGDKIYLHISNSTVLQSYESLNKKLDKMDSNSLADSAKINHLHGSHVWTIENFDLFLNSANMNWRMFSEAFHARKALKPSPSDGSHRRQLVSFKLVAGPLKENNTDYIGLYLRWTNPSEAPENKQRLNVKYRLHIVDKDGMEIVTVFTSPTCKMTKKKIRKEHRAALSKEWIKSASSKILSDGCLRIRCEYVIKGKQIQESSDARLEMNNALQTNCGTVGTCLMGLKDRGELCDVTLICQGVELSCHKLVLAARSEVFQTMFANTWSKEAKTGIVDIKDSDPGSIKQMINFMYLDKCNDLSRHVHGLMSLANKYNIPRLMLTCEMWMLTHICTGNAVDILLTVDLHNSFQVKKVALDFVALNISGCIKDLDDWKQIEVRSPDIVRSLLAIELPNGSLKVAEHLANMAEAAGQSATNLKVNLL